VSWDAYVACGIWRICHTGEIRSIFAVGFDRIDTWKKCWNFAPFYGKIAQSSKDNKATDGPVLAGL